VGIFSKDVTHALVTGFPWVMGEKPVSSLRYLIRTTSCKFMILDSGVYSLYLKDEQGELKLDAAFLERYTDRYIKLIKAVGWNGAVVEVDSQNLGEFGPQVLPVLRKKFADAGLADQTLHVWHLSDGVPAFRDMLKKYKRIALSGRMLSQTEFGLSGLKTLLRSNRDLIPGHHIHLLGSVNNFSATLPDNFTADSSNWGAIGIHGHTDAGPHRIEYRRGKLTCPKHILDRVQANMSHMVNVYKSHPEHKPGRMVRRNYLTYMAAGLYLNTDYFSAVRKRNPGSDLSVIDPIEYQPKVKHART
jgi:hypothetical protein